MTVDPRAIKKGAHGDQAQDLLCVKLASYLECGPLMLMMPLHINRKSDYDDDGSSRVKRNNTMLPGDLNL